MEDTSRLAVLRERFAKEPLGIAMGAQLNHLSQAGWAVVKVPVREDFLIVDGIVQGGIVTAIADFAGVYAAMAMIPSGHTPASSITIDLIRPIKAGETIYAQAKLRAQTRGSIWIDVDVYAQNIDPDHLKAHGRIHFIKPKPSTVTDKKVDPI